MKFKVEKGTELYTRFKEIETRIKDAFDKRDALVKELGAIKSASYDHCSYFGGFDVLQFRDKPDGFVQVGKKYEMYFRPKASNKEVIKKIQSLPTVSYEEVNALINFKVKIGVNSGGIFSVPRFGFEFLTDLVLIDIHPEAAKDYEPVEGMTEIMGSEFLELKALVEKAKELESQPTAQ